jgi:hypothetical protein
MKSSTLIASYLWKDTFSRWREQPSTALARVFVGALMVAVAAFILVAFLLLERTLRERLENFGVNTLIVKEMVMVNDPELLPTAHRPDRLESLTMYGEKFRLRQLYARATTEWPADLQIMTYPPEAMSWLKNYSSPLTPLICISESWPENTIIKVNANRQTGTAIVRRPGPLFRPVFTQSLLLAPQGWAPELERIGYVEVNLFHRAETAPAMQSIMEMISLLFSLDRRMPPQLDSPLPMLKELATLQARQNQWRAGLAAMLGLALALVYGAIAILEFRQNLFVTALLRSLGAPSVLLFLRQWAENALLANGAAALAIFALASFHEALFGMLGFSKSVLLPGHGTPYLSSEILTLFIWVNIGAFLSALPVAIGLRKKVGQVLN